MDVCSWLHPAKPLKRLIFATMNISGLIFSFYGQDEFCLNNIRIVEMLEPFQKNYLNGSKRGIWGMEGRAGRMGSGIWSYWSMSNTPVYEHRLRCLRLLSLYRELFMLNA
jgi:hypothetical protein